eukprot:SAG22_NODE_111_length_19607_cov_12.696637_19_plen_45_part_00
MSEADDGSSAAVCMDYDTQRLQCNEHSCHWHQDNELGLLKYLGQ